MESHSLNELIEKYKLSKGEHSLVLELLKKNLFSDSRSEEHPSIMFVVGQPGCGKTTFINRSNFSKYIIINSDDYRSFSKYSKEILEKYPTYYAKLTNYDAHLWGDELFSYAIQNGYSVLREKAPTDYSLLELLRTIPYNYDVVINVVVTGNLSSLLATRERYEKEILKSSSAKLSNIEAHNTCYALLPDFIVECQSLGLKVNYIIPVESQFKTVAVGEDSLDLLQKIREESNEQACLGYNTRMNAIKKNMLNRNASQEQFVELEKIESIYHKMSCNNNGNINNNVSNEKKLGAKIRKL